VIEFCRVTHAAGDVPVLLGAPGDAADAARVTSALPVASLVGRDRPALLPAVLTEIDALVSGDTGVAHLATALRTPSVVLFGPTPPDEWGPPPGRPAHRVLWAGRRGDPHGDAPDPGLLEISVGDVLAALAALSRAPRRVEADGTQKEASTWASPTRSPAA
jgi:ADP-heptose:LPS heptosyltransferase